MPIYDFKCSACERVEEHYVKIGTRDYACSCGAVADHVWQTRASVIGDEIDVTIEHALCWPDGTPRRFRSRQELSRAADKAGYTNVVEHKGSQGSDRSKHTQRWI